MTTLRKPQRGLFIAGTNTEVGKTYITSLIAQSLAAQGVKVGVYKPVASGCDQQDGGLLSTDALALWEAAGRPLDLARVCPQVFAAPLAPHLAAKAEGKRVDPELLRTGISVWHNECDIVLVEGAGGLMSPLSDDDYVADLAFDLGYPLIVVASNELGVINQTLQTLITAATFRDGLEVAGVVLNDVCQRSGDESTGSNLQQLKEHCVPEVVCHVGYGDKELLAADWMKLADTPVR